MHIGQSILFQHFLVYLQTVLSPTSRRGYSAGEAVNTISYVRGRVILVLQLFDKINPDKVNKPVRYTKAHWNKSPLGQKPTGHNPTGQKPTAKFGRVDKSPLL